MEGLSSLHEAKAANLMFKYNVSYFKFEEASSCMYCWHWLGGDLVNWAQLTKIGRRWGIMASRRTLTENLIKCFGVFERSQKCSAVFGLVRTRSHNLSARGEGRPDFGQE
eukprot:gnl/MRDRNA2_/MRDRNA2_264141_c0_seq1.p1 gnl/MRDRNA2_/MRDRNA2_264141_c0~~gnl/MRDRNA2_/MRDRNA2_264141_c0_seq1.p1  ORF type:complete len:110 (+),score=8.22 gnl/MRDRNA2_/MRDRNA2_264141_c0_seq1:89-418(+)